MAPNTLTDVLRQLRRLYAAEPARDLGDGELLERFLARREETAFAILVQRHGPMVLGVCRRVLRDPDAVEDAFQATFLALVQRSASIRQRGSLGSWLYAVARRIARRARERDMAQRNQERGCAERPRGEALDDPAWRELRSVLDEEVGALPERYRAPVVLCYLEGKSYDQAARDLGWPKSSLASRLSRARGLLRQRLARRGLALSAAALAAGLAEKAARAAVPALLTINTVKGATRFIAGQAAPGALPSPAVALAEESMKPMLGIKSKVLFVLLAVGLAAGGVGLAGHQAPGGKPPPGPQADAPGPAAPARSRPAQAKPVAPADETFPCAGRVLDPDGKPASGARLLLLGKGDRPVDLGTSAADGRFLVRVPKDLKGHHLVARGDGSGMDFTDLGQRKQTDPVELRLVKDQAIRGRVLDTEGKPVSGAKVVVTKVGVYAGDSLDPFLADWKKRGPKPGSPIPSGVKGLGWEAGVLPAATTDRDGRFTIAGAGSERLVTLRVRGAGTAESEVLVVNRDRFDPKPYNEAAHLSRDRVLYGPSFTVVAEREKRVRGRVTEAGTGKGVAGVRVLLGRNGHDPLSLPLEARTDTGGRYEIRGARKARSYMVEVSRDHATGHLAAQARADDTPGYDTVTLDVRAQKGVVVTGRVMDRSTAKAVRGNVMIMVLKDNPFEDGALGPSAWYALQQTAQDGTFRMVTVPGPVLLMAGANTPAEMAKYKRSVADPKYPKYFAKRGDDTVFYGPGGCVMPLDGNFCKVLELKPDAEVVTQDIHVEPVP
jgi:RNA polymerase sigma factor (sigma-70 family)